MFLLLGPVSVSASYLDVFFDIVLCIVVHVSYAVHNR